MIKVLDHPIVHHYLSELRKSTTKSPEFRKAAEIISTHLAMNCMQDLKLRETNIQTPMEQTKSFEICDDIVFVPILRAGIVMLAPFQSQFPAAKTGFIGMKRNETTLKADEYMFSFPECTQETRVFVLDVMLATGNSLKATLSRLQLEGIENITVASIIAAPEGIENVLAEFSNVKIYTATIDRGLNNKGYILPGLGDAGDRVTGMA